MQTAIYQKTTPIQSQASYLPGHGTGVKEKAANDDSFEDQLSVLKFVLSVLANVIGGALLISAMFIMPHIIARMFM